jgi:hypothetical protein
VAVSPRLLETESAVTREDHRKRPDSLITRARVDGVAESVEEFRKDGTRSRKWLLAVELWHRVLSVIICLEAERMRE